MIAVDSSAFITFFKDENHPVSKEISHLLDTFLLVLPPVVLSELLSDPVLPDELANALSELIILHITEGYWQRVGKMRADILRRGLKSRLADVMIAQTCIDYNIPLFTCDSDFKHYKDYHKLKLYKF